MIKKTYTAKSAITISIILSDSMKATVSFAPVVEGGSIFVTTDSNIQQALEAHNQYGKLFKLYSTVSTEEELTNPKINYFPKHVFFSDSEIAAIQSGITKPLVQKLERISDAIKPDELFSNTIPAEEQKQAAMLQILMLQQMYGYTTSTIQNPEYTSIITDAEDKIIAEMRVDGSMILFGTTYK